MRHDKRIRFAYSVRGALLATALFLTLHPTALAQSDRGTITGTVLDASGASVPAAVTIINAATGVEYSTVATSTGNYSAPSLPAGRYNLKASAPGFSQYVQEGITVQVSQSARVDIVLQIGGVTDRVTVTADAVLLKTEGADQSQTVSGDQINRLPLTTGGNGLYGTRNPLAALDLAPGANNTTGTNFVFRVNGVTNNAKFLLDGQDISLLGMASSHLSESHPSTEAVQEVTLLSSNFAAEFGQVQGGLVSFTTRSGTNRLHGGGYDYLMNEALNAGRPFTSDGNGHLIRPRQRNNNYGFTVGGPVWLPKLYNGKNRTFFFFAIDQFLQRATVTGAALTVPTDAYRTGDFSAALTGRLLGTDPLGRAIMENTIYDPRSNKPAPNGSIVRDPFPDNKIPANLISPVAQKIQALIPRASLPGVVQNLALNDKTYTLTTLPSFKIDHQVNEKLKINFYFGDWINYTAKSTGDGLPEPISNAREFRTHTPSFRLNADYTVTPRILIHAGVGEIRYWHIDSGPEATRTYDAVGKLGLIGGLGNPTGFPSIGGLSSPQGGIASTMGWTVATLPRLDDHPTAVLNGSMVRGNHTYKAGGEWWRDFDGSKSGVTAGSYTFSGAQTGLPYLQTTSIGGGSVGFPYASFLLGNANASSIRNRSETLRRKTGVGVYIQDTWKVTRRLTLDYGIRYDRQDASREQHDRSASLDRYAPNAAAGGLPGATMYEGYGPKKCNCLFGSTFNKGFAPRVGVAFQINSKTVLRAGWGFVYGRTTATNTGGSTIGSGFNTLNFTTNTYGDPAVTFATGMVYDPSLLYVASYDPAIQPQPGTITSAPNWVDDTSGRPGRINQWNVSLQREVLKDLTIEAAYVGSRGSHISGGLTQFNALTIEALKAKGFDITNAADRTVLNSPWNSTAAQARGIKAPYAGYPTGLTVAQTLRPYPQFGNLGATGQQRANSWYDALQSKLTQRFSHGLTGSASFTWQKELELGNGPTNDSFNIRNNKNISGSSQPFALAIGLSYETPAVTSHKVVRAVVRGWTIGSFFRFSSGLPIPTPSANNNLSNYLFQSTRQNRVAGVPLFLKGLDCHCIDPNKDFVLNKDAWADPAQGTWGVGAAYYNDYRFQRHPREQIGIGRLFSIREAMSLEVRMELFNVFNRAQMADPTATNPQGAQQRNSLGVPTAGFGFINSQSPGNASVIDNPTNLGGNPRQGQLLVRFRF
ncbi:MAG: TonB-dependent receptor [Candidatus Solibacter sp.]